MIGASCDIRQQRQIADRIGRGVKRLEDFFSVLKIMELGRLHLEPPRRGAVIDIIIKCIGIAVERLEAARHIREVVHGQLTDFRSVHRAVVGNEAIGLAVCLGQKADKVAVVQNAVLMLIDGKNVFNQAEFAHIEHVLETERPHMSVAVDNKAGHGFLGGGFFCGKVFVRENAHGVVGQKFERQLIIIVLNEFPA